MGFWMDGLSIWMDGLSIWYLVINLNLELKYILTKIITGQVTK